MTKTLVIQKTVADELTPVDRTRVYVADMRAGLYPRDMFVEELKRRSTLFPSGTVKWEDVIIILESGGFVRYQDDDIVVDRAFSQTVVADLWEVRPIEKTVTRTVKTHVGILRWASDKAKGADRYKRVIELLVYWTPDNSRVVDEDAMKMEFFRRLLECTPIMVRWGFGIDFVMSPADGWGNPYSDRANSGKATFEVAETTAEYPDGFFEYNNYSIEDFLEGIELIKEGVISLDDLKLRARGGREATEKDVENRRATFPRQIIGGGDSGIIDVNTCLADLRRLRGINPMEVVK